MGTDVDIESDVIEVEAGKRIRIEVSTDRADELHVHGYEIKKELVAGQVNVLEFVAEIPGAFEVEMETSHKKLFELRVR